MQPRTVAGRLPRFGALLSMLGAGVTIGPALQPSASDVLEPIGMAGVTIPASSGLGQASTPKSGPLSADTLYETTAEITGATDLTTTQQGAYLTGLTLKGGATPGWLAVLLADNVFSAILPVPASGTDATGAIGESLSIFYPMSVGPLSGTTAIPAGAQTFGGGLAAVQAHFSTVPNPHARRIIGPNAAAALAPFRAVAVTGNETGTGGTAKTYTVPGGNTLSPRGMLAMMSVSVGTLSGIARAEILMPATPPFTNQQAVIAESNETGRVPRVSPVGKIGPASSFSLTHKALSLGGGTDIAIAGVLFI